MSRDDASSEAEPAPAGPRPGQLSAILRELVHPPEADGGSAWDPVLRPGAVIGRFELVRELGRGGFGVVWEARDRELGRAVAFKAVRATAGTAPGERLLGEAEVAARLSHPNIVTLHDVGRTEQGAFLVFELLRGRTLASRLSAEPVVPIEEALRIATDVAAALAHAHDRGVVHRDLKPGNVFLCDDGRAKVLDLGLALAFGRRKTVGGTPAYMAPEQWRDAPEDERTDVFALGVILFQMLAGELPFPAHTAPRGPARALDVPGLPALPALLAAMLEADPLDRPRDGAAVLSALQPLVTAVKRSPRGPEAVSARSLPAREAIAVLPFVNRSADREDAYLGDALAEEIINALAHAGAFRVVPRTSSFAYRGDALDARAIGRALQAASVLEGSVQRAGDRLRVTVQLFGVAEGYQLWAERFDGKMEDVFAIQDEVARNVARALRVVLSDPAGRPGRRIVPRNIAAYEHYLRGRQFLRQTRRTSLRFACDMFERAIASDPEYALAFAGLAEASGLLHMYYPPDAAALERAERASATALRLRPDLAEAHAARGLALSLARHPEEAREAFERAIALAPGLFEAYYYMARACFREGRLEEAARLFAHASEVQEDYQASFFAAQVEEALGRHQEALAGYRAALVVIERHMDLNPDDPRASTMRAVTLCRLGQREEGLRWAEQALAIDPQDAGVRYNVACLYALEGAASQALTCLEEVLRAGFTDREWMQRDPDLASLRDVPRFKALMARP